MAIFAGIYRRGGDRASLLTTYLFLLRRAFHTVHSFIPFQVWSLVGAKLLKKLHGRWKFEVSVEFTLPLILSYQAEIWSVVRGAYPLNYTRRFLPGYHRSFTGFSPVIRSVPVHWNIISAPCCLFPFFAYLMIGWLVDILIGGGVKVIFTSENWLFFAFFASFFWTCFYRRVQACER